MTAAVKVASGLPSERRLIFPGTYRLKKRTDFQRIYSHGYRVPGRFVVLFVAQAELPTGRYGITASRKVGGAVVRARCKRRLRELYRLHRPEHGVAMLDIVANARRGCATAPWCELERDFLRCLKRGGTRGAAVKADVADESGS
jgi:ribonuclease P protein component